MRCKKLLCIIFSILIIFQISGFCCYANEIDDAELLYTKIDEFLSAHRDVKPEDFDDVCREFMKGEIPKTNLLTKEEFEEQSKGKLILYRGFDKKEYADEFREGHYFLSRWNVRGMGIYTTNSLDCAKTYSVYRENDTTLIKMFISKDEAKILDNSYLKKIQKIITEKHTEDFGEFAKSPDEKDYIYDSLSDYINKLFADKYRKLNELTAMKLPEEEHEKEQNKIWDEISDIAEKLQKDPTYQKLQKEGKGYYKTNKANIWFNSGLLAKLMGFDVLYTKDSSHKEDEYLIVNPNILYVLV